MEVFGPVSYPRRQLNPELRKAAHASMRGAAEANRQQARGEVPTSNGLSGPVLTTLAGFPHQSELSRALNAQWISASPRTIARLKALAQVIGFGGDIFADQQRIVEHEAPAHGARQ